MKIISWNVNGIRAVYKKNLSAFVEQQKPDILCVQETKAHKEQLEPPILSLGNMKNYWSAAVRKGYSGVATFTRTEPSNVETGIGIAEYDSEGRFVITHHPGFLLYNIYFPNGGSGDERHQFKQKFLAHLFEHLQGQIKKGHEIIVVGDYNIAHREMDIYDPVRLAKESGFLPEERQWMDRFFDLGFVDTFRYFHKDEKDRYTWWSYRELARIGNRGWRIDYISVTKGLLPRLKSADILDHIEGSDHCPVVLEMT